MSLFTQQTVLQRVQTTYWIAPPRDEVWKLVMVSCPPTEMLGTVRVRCGPYHLMDLDVQALAAASRRWEAIADELHLRAAGDLLGRELKFLRVEDAVAPGLEMAPAQLLSALMQARQVLNTCVRDTANLVALPPVEPVVVQGYQQVEFAADTASPLTLDLLWHVQIGVR